MIMISHEVKLKLIELAKAVKEAKSEYGSHPEDAIVLIVADELCKMLPPEITDGVTTNVLQET